MLHILPGMAGEAVEGGLCWRPREAEAEAGAASAGNIAIYNMHNTTLLRFILLAI